LIRLRLSSEPDKRGKVEKPVGIKKKALGEEERLAGYCALPLNGKRKRRAGKEALALGVKRLNRENLGGKAGVVRRSQCREKIGEIITSWGWISTQKRKEGDEFKN